MRTLSVALLAVATYACVPMPVQRQVPPCPPPPPPPTCAPTEHRGSMYDTTRLYDGVKWSIRRVEGASGPDNEWALYTSGTTDLLLTGYSAARARYIGVQRRYADTIRRTPLLETTPAVLLTQVDESAITGDADVVLMSAKEGHMAANPDPATDALNKPLHWDGHPTVSADGLVLVFASDRPGTLGGTDLWYCLKTSDGWSEPRRVSGPVNTPCDELSPRFAGDSVIVFASAGHASVGGYDLFTSRYSLADTTLTMEAPRNFGTPVNTPFDELFPVWTDNRTLYYSSDQPRRQGADRKDFDLFVLTSRRLLDAVPLAPLKPLPLERATVTGTVINKETQQPVVDADVTARDVESRDVLANTRTDTAGIYNLDIPVNTPVDVSAQAPDLFYDDIRVVVPDSSVNDTVRVDRPLQLPVTYVLRVNFPTAIYDDPYVNTLDSNGIETTQTWQESLNLLARNVQITASNLKRLVLIGHTDDVDTEASNLILGRNRVNFIMDELVARGVDRALMEGRSAGESLLPEQRAGESKEMWRKRARRVELVKVLQE